MYTTLINLVFSDSFVSPMSTIYVVSDSQLDEIRIKQRQVELDNLEASRTRLEESYQSRIKIIDEREHELEEELKALNPKEKTSQLLSHQEDKCDVKS